MAKEKLTPSERSILRELIFPESFEFILGETGLTSGTLRDDLIKLINHRYIEVFNEDYQTIASPFYDSDNLQNYCYKATKTGLKNIQQHAV